MSLYSEAMFLYPELFICKVSLQIDLYSERKFLYYQSWFYKVSEDALTKGKPYFIVNLFFTISNESL